MDDVIPSLPEWIKFDKAQGKYVITRHDADKLPEPEIRLCPCCKTVESPELFQCTKCTLHLEACHP
mgnify:CR=1 FL=1